MSLRRSFAVLGTLGVALGSGLIAVSPAVAATSAPGATGGLSAALCPPELLPPPANDNQVWHDDQIGVFAGGDFIAESASAESEGLLVVLGDATFRNGKGFNVGTVGVGSGVSPTPGEVMLAVGGDIRVEGANTVLDVGANATNADDELVGGSVQVGGNTTPAYPAPAYRLNEGTLTEGMGADAVSAWAEIDVAAMSQAFSGREDTGEVTGDQWDLTFTGDGTSLRQVFTVSADKLTEGNDPAIHFLEIPEHASVVVNVTGSGDVVWAPTYFTDSGDRVDGLDAPRFGQVAGRTLWNFADADSVHIDGSSQVLGSLVVPAKGSTDAPAMRITASTNGVIYTAGSIIMDGQGNEQHFYPWIEYPCGSTPEPGPEPEPQPEVEGAFTITKTVQGENAPQVAFSGAYSCSINDAQVSTGMWELAAGETTDPIVAPVGASCAVSEDLPADTDAGTWGAPVVSGSPAIITKASAQEPVRISVLNTFVPAPGPGPEPTPTPEPTPDPEPTPTPEPTVEPTPAPTPPAETPEGELATTGGTIAITTVALGALLLVAGLLLRLRHRAQQ
ncbi:choice-of-anchor A family protein [Microbacterium esteraromaticum]|uniref:choice-of-anchor A family protein n=1 Tax=Microbacterium esteraromaticum TaxID=57043 RepID=UPI0019D3612A|nr:choice-of-anchor A family protein [Microbacterium esteraromaticum]MBN7794560.1 choice-of-anchor A family protein [Microbacterium esteraromaticum]